MEKIVFLDRNSLQALIRQPEFAHEWTEYPGTTAEQVVSRLKNATIAIVNKVPLRQDDLAQLPDLRLIAVAATGYNLIDLDACRRQVVTVTNVTGYAVHAVPEQVLMLMLALRRNLPGYSADVAAGEWNRASQFSLFHRPIHDLYSTTLGIIGSGTLGRAVADLARAIGMRILIGERRTANSVRDGRTGFASLLAESDVVSLHCPLTDETRDLIGWNELTSMKRTAILINAARGGLVNEADLVRALQSGEIAGAGFDVLSEEPPSQGNPLLDAKMSNLIVTPHNAWASQEAMQALADQLIEVIEGFVAGRPKNVVT
jgi:glycerate dehydrogenase